MLVYVRRTSGLSCLCVRVCVPYVHSYSGARTAEAFLTFIKAELDADKSFARVEALDALAKGFAEAKDKKAVLKKVSWGHTGGISSVHDRGVYTQGGTAMCVQTGSLGVVSRIVLWSLWSTVHRASLPTYLCILWRCLYCDTPPPLRKLLCLPTSALSHGDVVTVVYVHVCVTRAHRSRTLSRSSRVRLRTTEPCTSRCWRRQLRRYVCVCVCMCGELTYQQTRLPTRGSMLVGDAEWEQQLWAHAVMTRTFHHPCVLC